MEFALFLCSLSGFFFNFESLSGCDFRMLLLRFCSWLLTQTSSCIFYSFAWRTSMNHATWRTQISLLCVQYLSCGVLEGQLSLQALIRFVSGAKYFWGVRLQFGYVCKQTAVSSRVTKPNIIRYAGSAWKHTKASLLSTLLPYLWVLLEGGRKL